MAKGQKKGFRHTLFSRRKMSVNNARYWLGKKRAPASRKTRKKLSIAMRGHPVSPETRAKIGNANTFERHGNWKGDGVGYVSLHEWIRRVRGEPTTCEFCGKTGLRGRRIHWANKSRKYKRDINDWLRLCASCHWKYDHGRI